MTLPLHLFATDASAVALIDEAEGAHVAAIIVPRNRAASDKVRLLREATSVPVFVQERQGLLPADCPPADGAIVWLYSQIFPPQLVASYPAGMLNMHGGALPEYRGASVLHWAIINGEPTLGVTWHGLVDDVDAGPIWAESRIAIGPDDTAIDVRARMIDEGRRLFPHAWRRMRSGQAPLRYPDPAAGRIWPQRTPRDSRFASGLSARQVRDLVRALCPPWPPAVYVDPAGIEMPVRAVACEPTPGTIAYATTEGTLLHLVPAT